MHFEDSDRRLGAVASGSALFAIYIYTLISMNTCIFYSSHMAQVTNFA